MDGGGRILRSLRESFTASLPLAHFPAPQPSAAVAGATVADAAPVGPSAPPAAFGRRRGGSLPALERYAFLGRPGMGFIGLILLFGRRRLRGLEAERRL